MTALARGAILRIAALIGSMIVALLVGAVPASAGTRVALVIGNSAYQNVPALPNPVNDATDIAASLKRLDFEVKILTNARFDDIRRALISFGQQARGTEFAVIYFAGHGMEVSGENWIVPVDAQLATDQDVSNETIGLQSLMRGVSNASRLGLVILDACRSNPFLPKMHQTNLTRAVERGFVRVEPNDNVLVAYSARDGSTAIDGSGRNSPFTRSLLNNIETPGLDVRFLFAGVRDEVMVTTKRQQQPFIYGSLSRETIYLKPPVAGVTVAAPATAAAPPQTVSVSPPVNQQPAVGATVATPPAASFEPPQQVALVAPPVEPSVPCSGAVVASSSSRMLGLLSTAEECALKPKDTFQECRDCPQMVVVPLGSFTMGSPQNEVRRSDDEEPEHRVDIVRKFAVGRFAVTYDEWDACSADGGCNRYKPNDDWGRGRRPVINVSWDDAKAYVDWLSQKTGKSYRLLSEAEREYVTRAATTTAFWWGASIASDQANYNGTAVYGDGAKGDYREKTVPVDSFVANPWGLYQVHGNVFEWVEDCYHEYYKEYLTPYMSTASYPPTDGSAWISGDCGRRVLRGGSWISLPSDLRSAKRYWLTHSNRSSISSFRIARTLR
jgi:formylglycine-generating enzyme required for sulfatase activity